MTNIILYEHQQEIIDKNPQRYGIFHDMGTGKTVTLLSLARRNNVTAMIVVPKGIKTQWENYVKEWKAPHTVITKEEFKKLDKEDKLPFCHAVIIDEAHHFSGMKSALYKQMMKFLEKNKIRYRWFATGTAYRSSPYNILALANLLGHKINYYTFTQEYFFPIKMGKRVVYKAKKHMEFELAKIINMIGSTLKMEDIISVPSQTEKIEYLTLSSEQIEAIEKVQEPMAITRFTKIHQVENGFIYGDGYDETKEFKNQKDARIVDICRDNKKVAVICRYNHQIERLRILLGKLGKPVFVITGDTKDRATMVQDANKADEAIIIIQAQCSEGYELQTFGVIVFASLSFSHVDHVQMKGRFLRMNHLKENTFYYLVVKGADSAVFKCIMDKKDFHESLYVKEEINIPMLF